MIAHRLNTVMDSDKVLFIDAGEIMEFGHPFELIQKPNGYFKRLLDQTGLSTATMLTLTAKEVCNLFSLTIVETEFQHKSI